MESLRTSYWVGKAWTNFIYDLENLIDSFRAVTGVEPKKIIMSEKAIRNYYSGFIQRWGKGSLDISTFKGIPIIESNDYVIAKDMGFINIQ